MIANGTGLTIVAELKTQKYDRRKNLLRSEKGCSKL